MSGFDFESIKILVVDDSRPMRSLISSFLLGFGVKDIYEAADADSGYEKLCDLDPDIVITDWRMPRRMASNWWNVYEPTLIAQTLICQSLC